LTGEWFAGKETSVAKHIEWHRTIMNH
jgi:hypothetical protein